jgi:anaerobic ribonucleoside-triphosphate reductase activating protein
MKYGAIKKNDIANGIGVRVSLFVSGCRNHCEGCFQPQTWDFDYGLPFTKETEEEIVKALRPSWIQGLSILGGEPMEPENENILLPFIKRVKEIYPKKDIWLYSGYTYEELKGRKILQYVDVLVDGRFEEKLRDPSLAFRGSSNQRILNVPASLKAGVAVLEASLM